MPQTLDRQKKGPGKAARRKMHARVCAPKEPEVGATYLSAWTAKQAGDSASGWKFNKATQSWLILHCYETSKVAKDVFEIFLRYLEGLQGSARDRMRTDAGTIVSQKGAPLKDEEAAETPAAAAKTDPRPATDLSIRAIKKQRRTEGGSDRSDAHPAAATSTAAADKDAEAKASSAASAAPEVDEEAEAKARKVRLVRAKKVLTVMGPAP